MRYDISFSLGIAFVVVAPSLAIWAVRAMKAAGTNVNPSAPALTFVRTTPSRFPPNPSYPASCLLTLVPGFFPIRSITILFVIPLALILHYGVILRAERYLEAKFGESYLALKRDVRRWI